MPDVGESVDRFDIVALLGQGGIARVFKVRHRVLGSFHALKVVTAVGPAVARRLMREGAIQAQLRHPNIVAVSDVLDLGGSCALVMEYVEGVTLEEYLARHGRLDVEPALALFAQVLAAVVAAHHVGVLHRDLKPGNVLLAPGPGGVLAKVTDFGLAKVLLDEEGGGGSKDTIQGRVMGTPGYMAPEQAGDAGSADARADVFALGVVLYELLVGRAPFSRGEVQATLAATLLGDHVPLGEARADVPAAVADAVERCLATRREARFPDASALARALYGERADMVEVVVGGGQVAPLALSMPSTSNPPGGANPTIAAVAPTHTFVPEAADEGARETKGAATGAPVVVAAGPSRVQWIVATVVGLGVALVLAFGRSGGPAEAPEEVLAVAAPPVTTAPGVSTDPSPATPATAAADAPPPSALPSPSPDGRAPATPAVTAVAASASTASPASPSPSPASASPASPSPASPSTASTASSASPPLASPSPSLDPAPVPVSAAPAPVVADAEPVAAPVAPVAPVAAPEAADPGAGLVGTWKGTWDGRPFTLKLATAGAGRLSGTLEVLVGTSYRTFRVGGTVDERGHFTVAEDSTPGWWIDGELRGGRLAGSLRHPQAKSATSYSATRR